MGYPVPFASTDEHPQPSQKARKAGPPAEPEARLQMKQSRAKNDPARLATS
ncbi:MAG TPA: hypothetical protein VN684_08450 [Terriglobales bacterium]|nr:hypothetical protein [Terriglobales bacterium]